MVEYFALKNQSKIKKLNCTCRIVAVGLSPTLDYRSIRTIRLDAGLTESKVEDSAVQFPSCVQPSDEAFIQHLINLGWERDEATNLALRKVRYASMYGP